MEVVNFIIIGRINISYARGMCLFISWKCSMHSTLKSNITNILSSNANIRAETETNKFEISYLTNDNIIIY